MAATILRNPGVSRGIAGGRWSALIRIRRGDFVRLECVHPRRATGRKQVHTNAVRPRRVDSAHDGLATVGEDLDDGLVDKNPQLQALAPFQLERCGLDGVSECPRGLISVSVDLELACGSVIEDGGLLLAVGGNADFDAVL